jgi:predicted DNA-binding antitoxin AbrB/MazE fold protein
MSKVIRVKYENGVLKPLEPLDLEEGEVLLVSIKKPVRELFGVLRRRNPRVRPEDVERVIEEAEVEGSL